MPFKTQNSEMLIARRYLFPGQGSRGSKYNLITCDNVLLSWMLRLIRLQQTLLLCHNFQSDNTQRGSLKEYCAVD